MQHKKTWYGVLATLGGLGYYSKAPGTLATVVACSVFILLGRIPVFLWIAVIAVGLIASDRYVKATRREDPGEIVIDEVAGYWASVLYLPVSYSIVAFFLFRVVDILKPFPVNKMEKLPGGLGVMADDICGGLLVNLLMRGIHWFYFSDGIAQIFSWMGL